MPISDSMTLPQMQNVLECSYTIFPFILPTIQYASQGSRKNQPILTGSFLKPKEARRLSGICITVGCGCDSVTSDLLLSPTTLLVAIRFNRLDAGKQNFLLSCDKNKTNKIKHTIMANHNLAKCS